MAARMLIGLLLLVACLAGCAREPADHGAILPADTVFWASIDNLPGLEASLHRHGLWELIVAELAEEDARADLRQALGIELSDDPDRDLRELLASLERLDVSLHPPAAGGDPADQALLVHLTAGRERPVVDLAAAAARHAIATHDLDGATVHVLPFVGGDDHESEQLFVLREGRDLLAASDLDLLAAVRARLRDRPDDGLAGERIFRRARNGERHDVSVYLSPDFPGASPSLLRGPAQPSLLAMPALVERYGTQATYLGADHGLTRMVSRTVLPAGSRLLPLMSMRDGPCSLLADLPRDTYALVTMLVQTDAEKAALFRELLRDVLAAAPLDEPPPVPTDDPLAMIDGLLGFDLLAAASLTTEIAVAAASAPEFLMLLRTTSADQAKQLLDMIEGSPALAFLPQQGRHEAGGASLRIFALPMDPTGRSIALGRRDETVLLLIGTSIEELDAYLTTPAGSDLAAALPAAARRQLTRSGHAWTYLDMAGLASAHGLLEYLPADLPAPLAERLRGLVLSGIATMPEPGVQATVMELARRGES